MKVFNLLIIKSVRLVESFQIFETLFYHLLEGFRISKRIPPPEAKVRRSSELNLHSRCEINNAHKQNYYVFNMLCTL